MKKHVLLVSSTLLVLLSAMVAAGTADIYQNGGINDSVIDQTDAGDSVATILQGSEDYQANGNSARISQSDAGNSAAIDQSGNENAQVR